MKQVVISRSRLGRDGWRSGMIRSSNGEGLWKKGIAAGWTSFSKFVELGDGAKVRCFYFTRTLVQRDSDAR